MLVASLGMLNALFSMLNADFNILAAVFQMLESSLELFFAVKSVSAILFPSGLRCFFCSSFEYA